jgi:tetratricopeptide (TPR) repeat protein
MARPRPGAAAQRRPAGATGGAAAPAHLLAQAIQHHQQGDLAAAERLYRQVLLLQPHQPDALHLLGLILHLRGQSDEAVALVRRALDRAPRAAAMHANLGLILRDQRRLDEAEASLRRALALDPAAAETHNTLGLVLRERGDAPAALACFRAALARRPDYVEAIANFAQALADAGAYDDAVTASRRAIALRPGHADAYLALGNALRSLARWEEAIAAYRQALAHRPNAAAVWNNLGIALTERGDLAAAVEALQRAILFEPANPALHTNLAAALRKLGDLDGTIRACRRALALKPDHAEAYNGLGLALADQSRLAESEAAFRQALALAPDYADAHLGLALTLLLQGRLPEGWAQYEWRWRCPPLAHLPRRFPEPLWDGGDLAGRTLLLHAEQGFGDTLQFVRFLARAPAWGGPVALECQPPLHRLLRMSFPAVPLVARGEPLPPFDVQAPLLRVPYLLGTTLDTLPAATPYLRVDAGLAAAWAARLAGPPGRRVGLVWSGNPDHREDRHRTLPPAYLAPLLAAGAGAAPPVRFFSLQKGERAARLADLQAHAPVADLGPDLADFADTAAALLSLDLVITVDTAVAHLAGALGRPVWTLLAYAADWRWLRGRDDSPWYPTMRLFRQDGPGDWSPVIARVAAALQALATPDYHPHQGGTP